MTHGRALAVCLLGVIILSPDALLIRLTGLEPATVLFWRGLMQTTVIVGGLYLWLGNGLWGQIAAAGWRGVAYAGLFGLTASGFVYATITTTVANTLFIVATSPIWAAILGRIFIGQRITPLTLATIGAVLIGMVFIGLESLGGEGALRGDLAALACAIGMASAFTVARSSPVSMVPMAGFGGVAISATGLLMGGLAMPEPAAWPPLLLMGLLVVPISFSLVTFAAGKLPPSDTALIMLLEAPFGMLLVWAFLAEQPGPLALIGGAIVLSSLIASNLIRRRMGP